MATIYDMTCVLSLLLVLSQFIAYTYASVGDRSYVFHKCMKECVRINCSDSAVKDFIEQQPIHLYLLNWSCKDECDYDCMWQTIDAFKKDGSPIPQFHGKWPFVRFLGIQEPASAFFSFLNGLAHVLGLCWYRKYVTSRVPLYWLVHFHVLSTVHIWLWSLIFHSRDFPFTEKMDYFCVMWGVLSLIFFLCARNVGRNKKDLWKLCICAVVILSFFVYHVHYMTYVLFDYGYNMRATITAGVINSLGWIAWSGIVCMYQQYVWKVVLCVLLGKMLLVLEVLDFPPIWWIFDAHSLWHLGTIFLPILWYSFLVDDCKYMDTHPEQFTLSACLQRFKTSVKLHSKLKNEDKSNDKMKKV